MDFFSNCHSKEEVKQLYRKLAKCFHPDHGGCAELMIELERQKSIWSPKKYINENSYLSYYEISKNHPIYEELASYKNRCAGLELIIKTHECHIYELKKNIESLRDQVKHLKSRTIWQKIKEKFS